MSKAGVVGYRGYSGAELVRLLERHPRIEPILLHHRDDFPAPAIRRARAPQYLPSPAQSVQSEGLAVVFLATPPDVSMDLAPLMLEAGTRVIDLSVAFR